MFATKFNLINDVLENFFFFFFFAVSCRFVILAFFWTLDNEFNVFFFLVVIREGKKKFFFFSHFFFFSFTILFLFYCNIIEGMDKKYWEKIISIKSTGDKHCNFFPCFDDTERWREKVCSEIVIRFICRQINCNPNNSSSYKNGYLTDHLSFLAFWSCLACLAIPLTWQLLYFG